MDKIKSILAPLLEDDAYSMEWAKDDNTPNTIIDVTGTDFFRKEFNEDIHRLFEIWKMDDEWYFIINWHRHEDEDRYLKCDQWDGFEECLTNCVNEVIL